MKKLFHIDRADVVQENDHLNMCVTGWCIPNESECMKYYVNINRKEYPSKYELKHRPDVIKALKKNVNDTNVGFEIKVENILVYETDIVEIVGADGDKEITLIKYDRKQLESLLNESFLRSNVDNVEVKNENNENVYYVTGWAILHNLKDDIEICVKSSNGKQIDCNVVWSERKDLVDQGLATKEQLNSGFQVRYVSERENDRIIITSRNGNVYKEINVQTFIERNKKAERTILMSQIKKSVNIKNGVKLVKYVSKHGFKDIKSKILHAVAYQDEAAHYQDWFNRHKATVKELEEQKGYCFEYAPKISILVPTYNTPLNFLKEMIDSVRAQSYPNWQLCIGEGSQGNKELEAVLEEYHQLDSRIIFKVLEKNEGISGNTNGALSIADGEFIGLLDHDDLMEPDALFEIVKELQDRTVDIVYTDEDKVMGNPLKNIDPNFKPDFSMDLFRSHNYITHFFCVRKSIVDEIGGFRSEYDGSQDYDLMFRCIEKAKEIRHVAKILYHWRMHAASTAENPASKMYCYDAGKRAIEAHLERIGVKGNVEHTGLWGMYHVTYHTPGDPMISIVIPNKDHTDDLDVCIRSIIERSHYRNFEFIIVENNSEKEETFEYYKRIQSEFDYVKVVFWDREFNYSAINNYGVSFASGDYILLLNNDTELIEPDSLSDMLGICMRDEVGIVGAKLLFADDTVQHAGIVLGFGGFAGHVFSGIGKDDYGYMVRARINCNYSAVTAACLMTKKSVYEKVHGLSEEFVVALNDVDYCLKVREEEYLVVYDAFSVWHHYESKSRGYEDTPEKKARFQGEVGRFQKKWNHILEKGDPYYNKNFPVTIAPFTLD